MLKTILIIAAHPDDETLGCGGIVSKFIDLGLEFFVLFIGEGSTCRFEQIDSKEAQAAIKERRNYAMEAMSLLGINDYSFNNFPCGRFDTIPIIEINKLIERFISEFKPDTILTHSSRDLNNDHRIVYKSTMMATRPGAFNSIKSIFSYEVLSSSEWAYLNTFKPNYFIEIAEHDLEKKWNALSLYQTEVRPFPFPRSYEGLKAQAMQRGMQSGFRYAESFQLVRTFLR